MLKRILLLLLCINICANEQPENTKLVNIAMTASTIGLGTAACVVYYTASKLLNPSSELDIEDVKKITAIGQAAVAVAGLAVGVIAAVKLPPIGREILSQIFPSEEQKAIQEANTLAARKIYELLNAKREFRACLLNKTGSKKNACKQAAHILAMLGGQDEVDRMTEISNGYKK